MPKHEREVVAEILKGPASRPGVVLWKNPVGQARLGVPERCPCCGARLPGRVVRYGLATGSSDLVGIVSVEISPEMVGSRIGRFFSVECKRPGQRPRNDQRQWMDVVDSFGGLAIAADDPALVEQAIERTGT